MQVEASEFGDRVPIRPQWLGVLYTCLFFLTAALVGMWLITAPVLDGHVTHSQIAEGSPWPLVLAADAALLLMAALGCYVPIVQARTVFTERAVLQRGLFRTKVVEWARVIRVRTGIAYTLETDGTSLRINPFVFKDRRRLEELLEARLPPGVTWVR